MKKILCQITMNSGKDISGSVIRENLRLNASKFDKVVVVDGNLTDEARQYYSKYPNLVVVDSPWRDSYVDQYRAWRDVLDSSDWALYLDCDEMPSTELLDFINSEEIAKFDGKNYNTFCIPCMLYLTEDNKKYWSVEDSPSKEFHGQWVKNILVKIEDLDFHFFGSHVIPFHGNKEKARYIPYPYYHLKSLKSFVYNDIWQAFLLPAGQHYSPADVKIFSILTKEYKTTKDFKEATLAGKWSPALEKFAWDRRKQVSNPVSRLAWVYWILEKHPMPEQDPFMEWDNVKQFVLNKDQIEKMEDFKRNNLFSIKIGG